MKYIPNIQEYIGRCRRPRTRVGPTIWDTGFHSKASVNPRFNGGILDFMENFSKFNMVHRNVHWQNPKLKSLNSMPVIIKKQIIFIFI